VVYVATRISQGGLKLAVNYRAVNTQVFEFFDRVAVLFGSRDKCDAVRNLLFCKKHLEAISYVETANRLFG